MDSVSSSSTSNPDNTSNKKVVIGFVWLLSLLLSTLIGFMIGQANTQPEKEADKNVLSAMYQLSPSSTPSPTATPTLAENVSCQKSGIAQKWEYLTAYVVKEGDSIQSIIEKELHDDSRINEVLQLNGVGPLVVGSTLYLPPPLIKKSSGNIKLVSGRLIDKTSSHWQISLNGSKNGQIVLIPSFWFGEITDKDSYNIGDCISVLFDDGYKVFKVTRV